MVAVRRAGCLLFLHRGGEIAGPRLERDRMAGLAG